MISFNFNQCIMCHKQKYLIIFILTYMKFIQYSECSSLSEIVEVPLNLRWKQDVVKYLSDHSDNIISIGQIKELLLESRLKLIHDIPKINLTQTDFSKMDSYNADVKPSILRRDFYLDSQNRQLNYLHHLHFASSDYTLELWPYDERQEVIKRISESRALLFYFSTEPSRYQNINNATLHFILSNRQYPYIDIKQIELQLYLITANGRRLLKRQNINMTTSYHWADFDITSLVRLWASGNVLNLGLELECQGCFEQDVYLSGFDNHTDDHWALLNIDETPGRRRRHRRSVDLYSKVRKARRTDCTKGERKCCRHSLEVSFQDLEGFDYIIQPLTFDAGYCKGRCPPRYNPASRHAILQSIMNKKDKSLAPRPCCAPSKLADLVVLHVDEKDSSKLKVSSWNDMRVVECACS